MKVTYFFCLVQYSFDLDLFVHTRTYLVSISSTCRCCQQAALWGELDCVRALLRAGCDRRCRDFSGIDAAEFARR